VVNLKRESGNKGALFGMKQIVALSLSVVFIVTSLPVTAYSFTADPVGSTLPDHGNHQVDPMNLIGLLELPRELGHIRERFIPDGQIADKGIIYIESAHANVDAETNVQSIIETLQAKLGLSLVMLEGGEGKLESLLFRSFGDEHIKRKVLQQYLRNADLSGGEAASILSGSKSHFYGIENQKNYATNKKALLEAIDSHDQVTVRLNQIETKLNENLQRMGSAPGKHFQKLRQKFRDGELGLLEYIQPLRVLFQETEKRNLRHDVQTRQEGSKLIIVERGTFRLFDYVYPELTRLLKSDEKEGALDRDQLSISTQQMIRLYEQNVRPKLPQEKIAEVNQLIQMYRIGAARPGILVKRLRSLGREVNYFFKAASEVKEVLRHEEELEAIEGTALFEELMDLEDDLMMNVGESEGEQQLLRDFSELALLRKLSHLELIPRDWASLKMCVANEVNCRLNLFKSEQLGLRRWLMHHIDFYTEAERRDDILFDNMMKRMELEGEQIAVVSTGGFHARSITKRLKESNIPFVRVRPEILEVDDHARYFEVMRGERSFMKYDTGSMWDALAKDYAARIAESMRPDEVKQKLKEWRDRIIQNAMAEGRVSDAGKYTKYVDGLMRALNKTRNDALPKDAFLDDATSKDQLRERLSHEIDNMFENYMGRLESLVKHRLDVFASGVKNMWHDGDMSLERAKNLTTQINQISTSNSNLATVIALIPGHEESILKPAPRIGFQKESGATKVLPLQVPGHSELRTSVASSTPSPIPGEAPFSVDGLGEVPFGGSHGRAAVLTIHPVEEVVFSALGAKWGAIAVDEFNSMVKKLESEMEAKKLLSETDRKAFKGYVEEIRNSLDVNLKDEAVRSQTKVDAVALLKKLEAFVVQLKPSELLQWQEFIELVKFETIAHSAHIVNFTYPNQPDESDLQVQEEKLAKVEAKNQAEQRTRVEKMREEFDLMKERAEAELASAEKLVRERIRDTNLLIELHGGKSDDERVGLPNESFNEGIKTHTLNRIKLLAKGGELDPNERLAASAVIELLETPNEQLIFMLQMQKLLYLEFVNNYFKDEQTKNEIVQLLITKSKKDSKGKNYWNRPLWSVFYERGFVHKRSSRGSINSRSVRANLEAWRIYESLIRSLAFADVTGYSLEFGPNLIETPSILISTDPIDMETYQEIKAKYEGRILGFLSLGEDLDFHWIVLSQSDHPQPAVVVIPDRFRKNIDDIQPGDQIVLKTSDAAKIVTVHHHPPQDVIDESSTQFSKEKMWHRSLRRSQIESPAKIQFLANMKPGDHLNLLSENKADGVGLYRTEIMTKEMIEVIKDMIRLLSELPGMDLETTAAFQSYREKLFLMMEREYLDMLSHPALEGKSVTVRTVDFQIDKNKEILTLLSKALSQEIDQLSGFNLYERTILGRELLVTQLAALHYAHTRVLEHYGQAVHRAPQLDIMFPMVRGVENLDYLDQSLKTLLHPDAAHPFLDQDLFQRIGDITQEAQLIEGYELNVLKAAKKMAGRFLAKKGTDYNPHLTQVLSRERFGVMIETMNAVDHFKRLLEDNRISFFEIGTNDLLRSMIDRKFGVKVDRLQSLPKKYVKALLPTLITHIEEIAREIGKYNDQHPSHPKRLKLAGQLTGEDQFAPHLVYLSQMNVPIGVSVPPHRIPQLRFVTTQIMNRKADKVNEMLKGGTGYWDLQQTLDMVNEIIQAHKPVMTATENWQERYRRHGYNRAFGRQVIHLFDDMGSLKEFEFLAEMLKAVNPKEFGALAVKDHSEDDLMQLVQHLFLRGYVPRVDQEELRHDIRFLSASQESYLQYIDTLTQDDPQKFVKKDANWGIIHPRNVDPFLDLLEEQIIIPRDKSIRRKTFYRAFHNAANRIRGHVIRAVLQMYHERFPPIITDERALDEVGDFKVIDQEFQGLRFSMRGGFNFMKTREINVRRRNELRAVKHEDKDEGALNSFFKERPEYLIKLFSVSGQKPDYRLSFEVQKAIAAHASLITDIFQWEHLDHLLEHERSGEEQFIDDTSPTMGFLDRSGVEEETTKKRNISELHRAMSQVLMSRNNPSYYISRLIRSGVFGHYFGLRELQHHGFFSSESQHLSWMRQASLTLNVFDSLRKARKRSVFSGMRKIYFELPGNERLLLYLAILFNSLLYSSEPRHGEPIFEQTSDVVTHYDQALKTAAPRLETLFGYLQNQQNSHFGWEISDLAWLIYQHRKLADQNLDSSDAIIKTMKELYLNLRFHSGSQKKSLSLIKILYIFEFASRLASIHPDLQTVMERQGSHSALVTLNRLFRTLIQAARDSNAPGPSSTSQELPMYLHKIFMKQVFDEGKKTIDGVRTGLQDFLSDSAVRRRSLDAYLKQFFPDGISASRDSMLEALQGKSFETLFQRYLKFFSPDYFGVLDNRTIIQQLLFLRHMELLSERKEREAHMIFFPLQEHHKNAYEFFFGASKDQPGLLYLVTGVLLAYGVELLVIESDSHPEGIALKRLLVALPEGIDRPDVFVREMQQKVFEIYEKSQGKRENFEVEIKALFTKDNPYVIREEVFGTLDRTEISFNEDTQMSQIPVSVMNVEGGDPLRLIHAISALNLNFVRIVIDKIGVSHPGVKFYVNKIEDQSKPLLRRKKIPAIRALSDHDKRNIKELLKRTADQRIIDMTQFLEGRGELRETLSNRAELRSGSEGVLRLGSLGSAGEEMRGSIREFLFRKGRFEQAIADRIALTLLRLRDISLQTREQLGVLTADQIKTLVSRQTDTLEQYLLNESFAEQMHALTKEYETARNNKEITREAYDILMRRLIPLSYFQAYSAAHEMSLAEAIRALTKQPIVLDSVLSGQEQIAETLGRKSIFQIVIDLLPSRNRKLVVFAFLFVPGLFFAQFFVNQVKRWSRFEPAKQGIVRDTRSDLLLPTPSMEAFPLEKDSEGVSTVAVGPQMAKPVTEGRVADSPSMSPLDILMKSKFTKEQATIMLRIVEDRKEKMDKMERISKASGLYWRLLENLYPFLPESTRVAMHNQALYIGWIEGFYWHKMSKDWTANGWPKPYKFRDIGMHGHNLSTLGDNITNYLRYGVSQPKSDLQRARATEAQFVATALGLGSAKDLNKLAKRMSQSGAVSMGELFTRFVIQNDELDAVLVFIKMNRLRVKSGTKPSIKVEDYTAHPDNMRKYYVNYYRTGKTITDKQHQDVVDATKPFWKEMPIGTQARKELRVQMPSAEGAPEINLEEARKIATQLIGEFVYARDALDKAFKDLDPISAKIKREGQHAVTSGDMQVFRSLAAAAKNINAVIQKKDFKSELEEMIIKSLSRGGDLAPQDLINGLASLVSLPEGIEIFFGVGEPFKLDADTMTIFEKSRQQFNDVIQWLSEFASGSRKPKFVKSHDKWLLQFFPDPEQAVEQVSPVAEIDATAELEIQKPADVQRTRSVLVVDDEEAIPALIKMIFEMQGFSVVIANNSQVALEIIREAVAAGNRFGLILSDFVMPAMNGLELAFEVHKIDSGIPIVVMTGFADLETKTKIETSPDVVEFLQKPFNPSQAMAIADKYVPKNELRSDFSKRIVEGAQVSDRVIFEFAQRNQGNTEALESLRESVSDELDRVRSFLDQTVKVEILNELLAESEWTPGRAGEMIANVFQKHGIPTVPVSSAYERIAQLVNEYHADSGDVAVVFDIAGPVEITQLDSEQAILDIAVLTQPQNTRVFRIEGAKPEERLIKVVAELVSLSSNHVVALDLNSREAVRQARKGLRGNSSAPYTVVTRNKRVYVIPRSLSVASLNLDQTDVLLSNQPVASAFPVVAIDLFDDGTEMNENDYAHALVGASLLFESDFEAREGVVAKDNVYRFKSRQSLVGSTLALIQRISWKVRTLAEQAKAA
jgi:CheY-like chemotaxis protein/phosphoenolpyruvate-protein kinase (PTS system EI component)